MRQCGELVLRSQLESMVEVLDQHLFLEGPRARGRAGAPAGGLPRRADAGPRSSPGAPTTTSRARSPRHWRPTSIRPAGPGPIGPPRGVRGARPRRAAHRLQPRRSRATRGRTARWPRRRTRTASSCSAPRTRVSTATPSRPPPRPSRRRSARSRSTARSWTRSSAGRRPISSPPSWRTGASTRSSSRRSGSSTSRRHEGRPRAADRAAPRELRPRVPRPRREPRPGRATSRRSWTPCADAMADRPAPLLHRGGRRPRPRRAPLRGPVAGRARRSWRGSRPTTARSSRPVVEADAEGFFAEARRQEDRNRICGLSPIYALLRLLPGDRPAGRLLRYGQWPDPDGHRHLRERELRGGRRWPDDGDRG